MERQRVMDELEESRGLHEAAEQAAEQRAAGQQAAVAAAASAEGSTAVLQEKLAGLQAQLHAAHERGSDEAAAARGQAEELVRTSKESARAAEAKAAAASQAAEHAAAESKAAEEAKEAMNTVCRRRRRLRVVAAAAATVSLRRNRTLLCRNTRVCSGSVCRSWCSTRHAAT